MKRILAVPFMFAIVLAVLTVALDAVSASGNGGTISLGAAGGSGSARNVAVVTGAATDPWSGYNIHIATAVGGELTLNSITDANGSLLAGGPICLDSEPSAGQRILGCVEIGATRASIVTAGQLAVFTFNTTGNGCLVVNLITVPGDRTTDTYTIDRATSLPQTNVVDTTPMNILVGTGQNNDCPSGVEATNTPTNTDKSTTTRTLTSTPTNAPTAPSTTNATNATNTPASGSGGTISLGAVGGGGNARTIEVVTGAATDPWSGYNIHIATTAGGGLTLNSITDLNGPLLTATPSPLCFGSTPSDGQRILGCATIGDGRASIAAAGQLAVFTFNTTGDGCLVMNLINAPGNQTTDTYTIDRTTSLPQTNVVDTTSKTILVGTGQEGDCPAPVKATNTPTKAAASTAAASAAGNAKQPDVTALPSTATSSGGNRTLYFVGVAAVLIVALAGAIGWRRWRR